MFHRHVRPLTDAEDAELQRMTQQEVGRVAERARMILLSHQGYRVQQIMDVFRVVDETVYKWFDRFDEEGCPGLYDRPRCGRPPGIDEDAEQEVERLLEGSPVDEGYEFTTWTTPLLQSHLRERLGVEVSDSTLRRTLARLEFVWRCPRWYIYERDPQYEERMSAIEEALSDPEVTVLFEDETNVHRLPPLRKMWMKRGQQHRVRVPEQNDKFALYGVLDPETGQTLTSAYPKGRSDYTEAFLEEVRSAFEGPLVLVWDQASWHTSGIVERAMATYDDMEMLLLPKRAPQENPVEDVWRRLKEVVAANLERSLEALQAACRRFFERRTGEEVLQLAGLAS